MCRMNRPSAESRDDWLAARVAHMLACPHTQVELLDEIMSTPCPDKTLMTTALRTVVIEPPATYFHDLALDTVATVLQKQAARRAAGEWQRLESSAPEAHA